MEIIVQKIDAIKTTRDYIISEVLKLINSGKLQGKINMSLDLRRPEYIMVEKSEDYLKLRYHFNDIRGRQQIASIEFEGAFTAHNLFVAADALLQNVDKLSEKARKRCDFEKRCYELYQLEWLMSHGYSIWNIVDAIKGSVADQIEEGYTIETSRKADNAMQCAIEEILNEGINGQMFVCIDEFLENEYKDAAYMQWLFNSQIDTVATEMKTEYARYTGTNINLCCDLKVYTSAGVLRAYKNTDPGQPGISILLQPAGFEDEIDVSEVCVYEDENLAVNGEKDVDVVIINHANPQTDMYTSKNVIKREAILESMAPLEDIHTRRMAIDIIEYFEEYLENCKVLIPSPDDPKRESENIAPIYGETYRNLADELEKIIIAFLNGDVALDKAQYEIYSAFYRVLVTRVNSEATPGLDITDLMAGVHFSKGREGIQEILKNNKELKDNGAAVISGE